MCSGATGDGFESPVSSRSQNRSTTRGESDCCIASARDRKAVHDTKTLAAQSGRQCHPKTNDDKRPTGATKTVPSGSSKRVKGGALGGSDVALLIGMDEAGLGPNLGPFVVAVTVWEVKGRPEDFDFWTAFDTILTNAPTPTDSRLHVADSKQIFQPQRGLSALERGVWSAMHLCGAATTSFANLCATMRPTPPPSIPAPVTTAPPKRGGLFSEDELSAARPPCDTARIDEDHHPLPWYAGYDCPLPVEAHDLALLEPWQKLCKKLRVKLVCVRAEVVEPLRFNRLVRYYDNKAQATSRLAMNLLRSVWQPDQAALIVADKHGGRNRYDGLLSETFGQPVDCVEEGAERSTYRLGKGELRFQPRAESHGPVALASMTAKYLRELAMHHFNKYWTEKLPELKPTAGYPNDAKRFREEIVVEQRRLGILDDYLWRER